MTIIVAGSLYIQPGKRDEFMACSNAAILLARANPECEDFAVSVDPVNEFRVNVFEKWQTRSALEAFRNSGPENDSFAWITQFDINEYEIES
ncbi:antibiotic biosynthesis monooxygenase [Aestuariibacter sp. GS-14]|uniref:putative quinol monooxygenase n=1 Tax=Aestuariibacter sp. GS-14 TaxID=2590670 RepID=UPI00112BDD12|nr:antibiotic biosynthesis monooxygenase [Aestuariibacter sp. GS-14]TPV60038.1 antibiotic biosynthesis monooxygenase [Aestuariibacter sp. GS-14]